MNRGMTEETVLSSDTITVERKEFHVEKRRNGRGDFVRITESAGGRENRIIVPTTGVDEFLKAVRKVAA
jgi:hypothetical protein